MIIPSLTHYVYGYRYTPAVANQFSNDLTLIRNNLKENTILVTGEDSLNYSFYQIFEDRYHNIKVMEGTESLLATDVRDDIATLGKIQELVLPDGYQLSKIITSTKSDNSDRIYIYRLNN